MMLDGFIPGVLRVVQYTCLFVCTIEWNDVAFRLKLRLGISFHSWRCCVQAFFLLFYFHA